MRAFRTDNGVMSKRRLGLSYVSIGNYDAIDFIEACRGLGWMDVRITAVCDNSETLNKDWERFRDLLDGVRGSDLCIVRMHGDRSYFPKFQSLFDTAAGNDVPMLVSSSSEYETEDFRGRFPYPEEDYRFALSLLRIGGVKNYTTLCLWACRTIAGVEVFVPDLDLVPPLGVYVPPCDATAPRSEDGPRPLIGLMMSHMIWRRQESQCIDRLVERLEAMGMDVLPVFFKSQRNPAFGSEGVIGCVKRYFMRGRSPIVDAIAVCRGFSQTILGSDEGDTNPFEIVGVPAIQCPTVYGTPELWERDYLGLSATELSASSRQPELDGQIDGVPLQFVEGRGEDRVCIPVDDRVERTAGMLAAWCRLRRRSRSEVRVAIVLNPAPDGTPGTARGLAPVESTRRVLSALRRRGYTVDEVPRTERELARMLSGAVTGGCSVPRPIDAATYGSWIRGLPGYMGEMIVLDHGPVPSGEGPVIGGVIDGNVYIGVEPLAEVGPHGGVSHRFLAFYRWIEEVFSADAVIHMGDHGQLEQLQGKMSGLSSTCWPDAILRSVVNICPFAVDDPGNAVVAKRRTHAVIISHLVPSGSPYRIPEGMRELESIMQTWLEPSVYGGSPLGQDLIRARQLMDDLEMWGETGLDRDLPPESLFLSARTVYDRISRLRCELVPSGLHVLGAAMRDVALEEAVLEAVSVPNGDIPSIRVALGLGPDDDPTEVIAGMGRLGFDRDACVRWLGADDADSAVRFIGFVCDRLVPGLRSSTGEMKALLSALEGRFVPPGPGGSLFGGCAHVLPVGRNIYATDPGCMPTREGWTMGSRAADETVDRYRAGHGAPPGTVAVFVSGGGSLANGGAELASAMRLAGLCPVWSSIGGSLVSMDPAPGRMQKVHVHLCMTPVMVRIFDRYLSLFRAAAGYDPLEPTGSEEDAVIAGRGMYGRTSEDPHHGHRRRPAEKDGGPSLFFFSGSGPDTKVQSPLEEASSLVRTRLANPEWVATMIGLSTDGDAEIGRHIDLMSDLSGIQGATEPWMFRHVYEVLVLSEEVRGRILDDHPAVLCRIIEMLTREASEGLWSPGPTESELLRACYLEAEARCEEADRGGVR